MIDCNADVRRFGTRLFIVSWLALCMLWTGIPTHAMETDDLSAVMAMLTAHMQNRDAWATWMQENAHPMAYVEALSDDDFADLAFLKPLLQDHRIVMLGESSHGVREFNLAKVRLIKFLHQELGFDVIAFESGWADAYVVDAQVADLSSRSMMEQSIYPVWHTEEALQLFDYIKEQSTSERPLRLAGIDMQPMDVFSDVVGDWFTEFDEARGNLWRELESQYFQVVYSFDFPWDELHARRPAWIEGYEDMRQYVLDYGAQLAALRPDWPELVDVTTRAIDERIRVLEDFVEAKAWLLSQTEETFALPARASQNYNYVRDLMMAEHLTWLAEEMFPDKKIIVWGHNYHIRKQNTGVSNDPLFMGLPMPTVGELLPDFLRGQTYSIGLYMFSGETNDNMRDVHVIAPEHDPDSIEAIMKHAGYGVAFVDLKHQQPDVGNIWMYTEQKALYWGMIEESFIPCHQYDGILWFDTVQPPEYVAQ